MSDTPIIIAVEAVTKRKHRITLRRDNGILYQSEINARKAEDREAFVRRVLEKFPGIVDAEALEKEIMEQANRQVCTKQSIDPARAVTARNCWRKRRRRFWPTPRTCCAIANSWIVSLKMSLIWVSPGNVS